MKELDIFNLDIIARELKSLDNELGLVGKEVARCLGLRVSDDEVRKAWKRNRKLPKGWVALGNG